MTTLTESSMKVLCKRYLLPKGDKRKPCELCGKKHETVDELWERVGFGNPKFVEMLSRLDFLPNSPTIFNAGTDQGTMSGCFKFDVDDSMESIMDVAKKAAMVLKFGGGTGFCFSAVRPEDSPVKSTHGKACGPLAVMRLYHEIANMITQGGKRHAAQMAILHCDHADIDKFITCKDNDPYGFTTLNLSVAATDDFMTRALSDLESPQAALFNKIVHMAWKTGDPGLFFIDTANKSNPTPWLGPITGVNACGEQPLLNDESCNLGSINLANHVSDWDIDSFVNWDKLERTTILAVRYLNNVLDKNFFPVESIENATMATRKIGIGVMGWADMLVKLRIHYDTQEAVNLGSEIMSHIMAFAISESKLIAEKDGTYPAYNGNPSFTGLRNAALTSIAPTGTIAIIAGCSAGIEPHFMLNSTRVMGDGTQLLEKVRVDTTDFIPKTAHEIAWNWHIAHQAAFQEYVDAAVSKTINLPHDATEETVRDAYRTAWNDGCKGITIYRDRSKAEQVIVMSPELTQEDLNDRYKDIGKLYDLDPIKVTHIPKSGTNVPTPGTSRRKFTDERTGITHKFKVGGVKGYITANSFDDGPLGEIFISIESQGSTIEGLMGILSIITSISLQHGVPLETIISKFRRTKFDPSGLTINPDIHHANSLVDYIGQWLELKFMNGTNHQPVFTGEYCTDCQAPAIHLEGCLTCSAGCGWSRC